MDARAISIVVDRVRDEFFLEEFGVALELGGGLAFVGLGGEERCLGGLMGSFCGPEAGLVKVAADLQEKVSLGDFLTLFDGQFDDFAGDFRGDLHLGDRLDLAGGHDQFGEVSAQDLLGLDLDGLGFVATAGSHQRGDSHRGEGEQADPGRGFPMKVGQGRHLVHPMTRVWGECFIGSRSQCRGCDEIAAPIARRWVWVARRVSPRMRVLPDLRGIDGRHSTCGN